MTYRLIFLFSLLITGGKGYSQLTVSGTKTPPQLVQQVLLGSGVTVFNISYTGSVVARGEFNGVSSNIGFNSGVLLTSGNIANAIGPNNSPSRSSNNGQPGDADINSIISPITSRDACVLEFDFRPAADTITFNYIFASEEYPEYAPPISSTFNDAFAFLLSGPNPAGGNYTKKNIALIPGTSTPVSINNVNAITNTAYYISNGTGFTSPQNTDPTVVQYDAFTVPLTAIAAVVPCATYHIKLVIADAFDFVYDSGVFLEANSFGSNVKNPTIDFISLAPACNGDTLSFLNTGSSGPGILFDWDFGSGASPSSSTLENPSGIIYSNPGLKLVTLSMNINCGDTTLKLGKGITINEKPQPSFSHNAPQCEGQPVNFTYTGTSGTNWTYLWDFGSNASPATSYTKNPMGLTYHSPGSKNVTLTVSNGSCIRTTTQGITINDRPQASFSSTAPAGAGSPVGFTNTGSTGLSYSWNFGSAASPATSSSENPGNITYSTSGTKTVTLITSASGCGDTAVGFIDILLTPVVSFTSNAPQPVGFPLNFTYTGNFASNFTFSWDFGSGAQPATSTSATPPSVFYNSPGTKTITLTVKNGPVVVTITQIIIIELPVVTSFTTTAPECQGIGVDFQAGGTTGTTYTWDFGSGASPASSVAKNPSGITYSTPGFKNVRLVSNLAGNNDTSFKTIYILPQPSPVFTHNAPQCEGAEVNFNYSGNTATNWTYQWDFGSNSLPNLSSATNPSGITYSGPGNKIIRLTLGNAMCSETDTQMITIMPSPKSGFQHTAPACTGDSVQFGNTGTSNVNYSWDFGVNAIPATSSAENNNVVFSKPGFKSVRQISTLGPCSDTSRQTVYIIERPQADFISNSPKCENEDILFTYSGTSNPAWLYQWDFGSTANPALSLVKNPGPVNYHSPGMKNVLVTVSNQFCSDTAVRQVMVNAVPDAEIFTDAPLCEGDSLLIAVDGPTSGTVYTWSFNPPAAFFDQVTGKAVFTDSGFHQVGLVALKGSCSDTAYRMIEIYDKPEVSFTSTAPVCRNEGVDFFNAGSSGSRWNYRWDFGPTAFPTISTAENPSTVRFSAPGDPEVALKIFDQHCFMRSTETVEIVPLPMAFAGNDTVICADACVKLGKASQAGISYSWFPAAGLDDVRSSSPMSCPLAEFSIYVLSAKDTSTSCLARDTVLLTMLNSALSNAGEDAEICKGDSVQIGASVILGQKYSWWPVAGLARIDQPATMASPDTTTEYYLRVSYGNCPEIEDRVKVTVHEAKARAGEDMTIAKGERVQLNASGGVVYQWSPPDYLNNASIADPFAIPEQTIEYTVKVRDLFNCESTDTIRLTVVEPNLFIPSAFTPDQSGKNDVFRVRGNPLDEFEISIFGRSGELIYYSRDFYAGWDGTRHGNGMLLPAGAYVYRIRGFNEEGSEVLLTGVVNLVR